MSNTIDERVVEMRFDNSDFEKNVQTSLSTLDKLKKGLNLESSAKGLNDVNAAASKLNFDPMKDGLEAVKVKFSALEVIALTALTNITNKAVDAGLSLAKSLTIEPVFTGFQEYETQINSVQTIMANTSKAFREAGKSESQQLQEVNNALSTLNTYADKTIYNFTQMTRNIGTFTAAGVDLETSVNAIQGIANLAAVSGSTSQQASTAMYQLSQALATGTVKLQDWNSVVNAGMGGQVFQDALTRTAAVMAGSADDVEKWREENVLSYGSFRDSLTKGAWLTTEVLTQTLSQFTGNMTDAELKAQGFTDQQIADIQAMAKTANDAATKVKTFTQLIDTLKEAAQSGWTQSWQIIIGDFEEAQALLTDISNYANDVIGKMSDARNAVLQGWKDLGGRKVLIDALRNALRALESVIKPVSEAFSEIFPRTTAWDLFAITQKFADFTAKLAIGDKTANNLKNTFKGFFSVLSIVKEAVLAVAGGAFRLVSALLPVGGGLLGVTGSFGEFLAKLNETIKETNIFKKVVDGLVNFILAIPSKISGVFKSLTGVSLGDAFSFLTDSISSAIEKIKGFFGEFGKIDTSGITQLGDKVKNNLKPLSGAFDGLKTMFGGLWEFLKKLSPIFAKLGTELANAVGKLGKSIGEKLKNADFKNLMNFAEGGMLLAIGNSIRKFIDNLKNPLEEVKKLGGLTDIANDIKDTLGIVKDGFAAWQEQLKAKTLKELAIAIGLITASLFVLSTIDSQSLGSALTGLGVEMGELVVMMKALQGIDSKGMAKTAGVMIAVSVAILLLSSACKKLSDLSWDELLVGVAGVGALSAILTQVAKQLSKDTGTLIKGAGGLILFAAAIRMLVGPVKELGALNLEELGKGLLGVGVLMGELALFFKTTDLDGMGLFKGLGIMALAQAVNMLANAVGKFAEMDTNKMIQGLAGVGAVLLELSIFTNLNSGTKGIMSTSIGMIALAAAMLIFGSAVEKIGNLNVDQLVKGLAGMGAVLLEISIAMNLLPKDMVGKSIGMLAAAAAISVLGNALTGLSGMSWEQLAIGLLALGGALAELSIALNLMNGTLAGSAALLVAAGALAILVPVLKLAGGMSWEAIGKGLIVLGGAFAVIGAAGLLLAPVVPAIIGLSGAIALLGVGALACGAGVTMLAAGLTALSASGVAGIGALTLVIKGIIGLMPTIVTAVAEGLIEVVRVIGESASTIATTVVQVGSAVLASMTQLLPQVVQFIILLLATIEQNAPTIIQSVINIVLQLLQAIRDNAEQIVTTVIETMVTIVNTIASKAGDLVQAGIDLMLALIEGLGQGIEDNADKFREALESFFEHMIQAVKNFLGIHSPSTKFAEIAKDMVLGLVKGIGDNASQFFTKIQELISNGIEKVRSKLGEWKTKGSELVTNTIEGVGNKIGEFKTKAEELVNQGKEKIGSKLNEWKTQGTELATNVVTGLGEKIGEFKSKAEELVNSAKSAIADKVGEWRDIGVNLAKGLAEGISSMIDTIAKAGAKLVRGAINAAKGEAKVASPSKVFMEIGRYLDEGLVIGIDKYSGKVAKSSANLSKTAIEGMRGALNNVSSIFEDDVETPVITPVLDLSEIQKNAGMIDGMFQNPTLPFNVTAKADTNNDSIISALKEAMSGLKADISNDAQNREINIYVYGRDGQNPREIAKEVENELMLKFNQLRAARA